MVFEFVNLFVTYFYKANVNNMYLLIKRVPVE